MDRKEVQEMIPDKRLAYYGNPGFLQMPVDVKEYQAALQRAMQAIAIPVVYGLEIGLGWGASATQFLHTFPEAKLFSQDLNDWLPARKELETRYPHRFQYLTAKDSAMWAQNIVEWLYIDAGHTYEEVLHDIYYYISRLKPGGVLCFDDYDNAECPGVRKAVDEFFKRQPLATAGGPTGIVYWIKP
jgi:hypothetical protein